MTWSEEPGPGPSSPDVAEGNPDVERLGALIAAHAPYDGSFDLRIPGVHAIRSSRTTPEKVHHLQRPALCLIARGAKSVTLGDETYDYDPSRLIVYSVDLPVSVRITQASASHPYLGLRLDLDPQRIAELLLKVHPHGLPRSLASRAVNVTGMTPALVEAASRLLELAKQPAEAEVLAPLVLDEILIRLLLSPIGGRVAQIGQSDSGVQRVAHAISWLRANFSHPMNVEDLAGLVHMSPSSFHRQFKSVTSMSPLQFQKSLRLQEARRLMLTTMMDAGAASRQVGYLSASQFSREYSRFFGKAPTRDLAALRERAGAVAGASS